MVNADQPQADLIRLVYVSMLSAGISSSDIDDVVARSRVANAQRSITGMLAVEDRRICQILEGPAAEVGRLYEKIRTDHRHHDIIDLMTTPIKRRHFGEWGMARRLMVDVVMLAFALES